MYARSSCSEVGYHLRAKGLSSFEACFAAYSFVYAANFCRISSVKNRLNTLYGVEATSIGNMPRSWTKSPIFMGVKGGMGFGFGGGFFDFFVVVGASAT